METPKLDLYVSPMEERKSFGEKTYYTLRTPRKMMENPSPDFFQTVKSIGKVAFHGKRGMVKYHTATEFIPRLMKGASELNDIADTHYHETTTNEIIPTSKINSVAWDCVDRREDDKGASPTEGTAQITHPGGLIMLDPKLKDFVPPHITRFLEQEVLREVAENAIKISKISAHFGAGNVNGCGGVNLLRGTSARAKELLSSPVDIKEALDRVRRELAMIMAPECILIGDVIFDDGGIISFNMDDGDDFKNMLETGKLNI